MNSGTTRSGWALVAAMTLIGGALTACTDDPPPTLPTTTTSSPTPTVTAPVTPSPEFTVHGAEQFARHFWDVYNYAQQIGDPAPIIAISDPSCLLCKSTVTDLTKLKAGGGNVEGANVHVRSAVAPPLEDPTRIVVTLVVRQDAGVWHETPETSEAIGKTDRGRSLVALEWRDNSWRIHDASVTSLDSK